MNLILGMVSLIGITAVVTPNEQSAGMQHDISTYLPAAGAIKGWKPAGSPLTFVGEGLYDLIDGGAVIYYEYGFRQTVVQRYEDIDGQSIELQIYEMKDPAGAYGMYTFLSDVDGEVIEIQNEGITADHYLYFWKGNYLVTLTSTATDGAASTDLLAFAKDVEARIKYKGHRPSICNLLSIDGQDPQDTKYLRGPLALSNAYHLFGGDIFGLEQGVVGDFGDFRLFILKYDNEQESHRSYALACNAMRREPHFQDFMEGDHECSMVDDEGLAIRVKPHNNYIFMYVGDARIDPRSLFNKLENNLR
ncbi:MAG: hypothetical protein JSU64_05470 [candidate division WOR-3 bacterium]|nr:MAG: hypothetical protein JSU64_05470 [candidate division WOR-3 bacterium]